jgi:hypothetical protein
MRESQLQWLKASLSSGLAACVELAANGEWIALRNSRDTSTVLQFTPTEISVFIMGAKLGEFDHLIELQN